MSCQLILNPRTVNIIEWLLSQCFFFISFGKIQWRMGWKTLIRLFGSLAGFVFISLKESFVKMFLSTFKLMLMLQWISWSCQNYIFFLLFTNSQYKPFDRANKENSSNKRKNKECIVHKNTSNNLQYLQL